MRKLRSALAILAVSLMATTPTAAAEDGPTEYRSIPLSAEDRATHGDDALHRYIDAYFAGRPLHHWSEAHPDTLAEHGHEAVNAWIVTYWQQQWVDAYWQRQWVDAYNRGEAAERAKQTGGSYVQGIEVCNGRDLPTCKIVRRESNFNPTARNPRSSAWGLYQFLRGTWNGVCPEYPHGAAGVAQQVECARRLWDGGRGSGHWALTR